MSISPDVRAQLIEPGTEGGVRKLHGRRFGTTYTCVIPLASRTIILVLPVHVAPVRPPADVVWAEVSWKHTEERWQCILHNLPLTCAHVEPQTLHLTLKQALWRARLNVIKYAAFEAELIEELPELSPLESVLAPDDAVNAYRSMVAQLQLHIPIRMELR